MSDSDKDEAKGKVKETVGEATGDDELADQGRADQAKGKVKGAADKLGDAMKKAKDTFSR